MSQRKEESPKGTETRLWDGEVLISETGTGQLEGGEMAQIVEGQNWDRVNSQRQGGGRQRNQRRCCRAGNRHRNRFSNSRRSGESIYQSILDSRHVHYRTDEFSQVSQVALLTGRPGWRNPEHGKG